MYSGEDLATGGIVLEGGERLMERTATEVEIKPGVLPLKCLHCGARLIQQDKWLLCSECKQQWPVTDGIPRFYQPGEYYWGELSRQGAQELLAEARSGSWRQAIQSRVSREDPLYLYYLDTQRAAWLALLGLNREAVALDIGCGYGAIAQSLALSVSKVCAIEAIPERIEFTQERLRQEGITNVSLFQTSATSLPFFENTFDLIVVNGVLEWVGEWELEGSPRSAQLKFLSVLRRLLKEDGVLVIGIENRFGLPLLKGGMDHSGLPYTSLVPRWMATQILRRKRGTHWRTTLNAKREYRTYTYSRRGYRRLLAKAGFAAATPYWAETGYNKPHRLIPLEAKPLIADYRRYLEHNGPTGRIAAWREKARISSLARLTPQFVLIASKDGRRQTRVTKWIEENLRGRIENPRNVSSKTHHKILVAAYTQPFREKSVLHFWDSGEGRIPVIAKVSTRSVPPGPGTVEFEFENLTKVHEKLAQHPEIHVRVPEPIGYLQEGNSSYTLEGSTKGRQFSRIIHRPHYLQDLGRMKRDFARAIKNAIEVAVVLQEIQGVPALEPDWYQLPDEVAGDSPWAERVSRLRYFSDSGTGGRESWTQHGDFSREHIYFDEQTGYTEIIDWDDLARGLPPLYDVFTMIFYSRLLNPATKCTSSLLSADRLQKSFADLFIEEGPLSMIVKELLAEALNQAHLDASLMPSLFTEFLLGRVHRYEYYNHPALCKIHLKLLRAYMDQL